jgi:hypothetical protein
MIPESGEDSLDGASITPFDHRIVIAERSISTTSVGFAARLTNQLSFRHSSLRPRDRFENAPRRLFDDLCALVGRKRLVGCDGYALF